jgi:hypothetical protein
VDVSEIFDWSFEKFLKQFNSQNEDGLQSSKLQSLGKKIGFKVQIKLNTVPLRTIKAEIVTLSSLIWNSAACNEK